MLEPKVLAERNIRDLDCHCDKLPALVANVCLIAACSYIVVVCEIDIEAQFFGQRPEGREILELFPIAWIRAVDRTDVKSRRNVVKDILAHEVSCGKGLVSPYGVVLKRVGEFSMRKVVGWRRAVIQPLEEISPGEEALIECAHDLGVSSTGTHRNIVSAQLLSDFIGKEAQAGTGLTRAKMLPLVSLSEIVGFVLPLPCLEILHLRRRSRLQTSPRVSPPW